MKTRPTSVTIISWYLIISSVLGLLSVVFTYNNPQVQEMMKTAAMPISWQYIMSFIGLAVLIFAAVMMLKGKHIGRLVYVIYTSISIVITFFNMPTKAILIIPVVVFIIIVFFLFRPKVNAYFSSAD